MEDGQKVDKKTMPNPKFDFIDEQVKADMLKEPRRKFSWKTDAERRSLYFEVMDARVRSKVPIPTTQMFVKKETIKQYLHSYGLRMNDMIPDTIHHMVNNILNEAIARVYALPGKEHRITIYPRDLPLVLL